MTSNVPQYIKDLVKGEENEPLYLGEKGCDKVYADGDGWSAGFGHYLGRKVKEGDLWINTDDNKRYRAAVDDADKIAAGAWILVGDAAAANSKIVTQAEYDELDEADRLDAYIAAFVQPDTPATAEELKKYPPGSIVPQDQVNDWFEADISKSYNAAVAQNNQLPKDVEIGRLTSVNYQLGTNWNNDFVDTWDFMQSGLWSEASQEALNSLWAREQSTARAQEFSNALIDNDLSTEEVTLFPRRQNLAAQGVDTPTEMPEGFNAGGRTRLI